MLDPFENIRSYRVDELPAVFARLAADDKFIGIVARLLPQMPAETLRNEMTKVRSVLEFQQKFVRPIMQMLVEKLTNGFTVNGLEKSDRPRLLVTNHRDIVIDSAFIDFANISVGNRPIHLGIGNNLMGIEWVKMLMLANNGFVVLRGLPRGEMVAALKQLSAYLRHLIVARGESIWIAQREGRAKDSNDRTQESILKMFALSGENSFVENLKSLNISPVSLSYEFDPCDYLKAKEMQQRRDNPNFVKAAGDDELSMKTGIMGFKGRVHFEFTPAIDAELDQIEATIENRKEQVAAVAAAIDRRIHENYVIYPINMVAYDELFGSNCFADEVSADDRKTALDYLAAQLAKIDLPNRDEAFLRAKLLEMYANPLKNKLESQK